MSFFGVVSVVCASLLVNSKNATGKKKEEEGEKMSEYYKNADITDEVNTPT